MDYKDILLDLLAKEEINAIFSSLEVSAMELAEMKYHDALKKIKAIIEDDSLEDEESFLKIEEIACVLESIACE